MIFRNPHIQKTKYLFITCLLLTTACTTVSDLASGKQVTSPQTVNDAKPAPTNPRQEPSSVPSIEVKPISTPLALPSQSVTANPTPSPLPSIVVTASPSTQPKPTATPATNESEFNQNVKILGDAFKNQTNNIQIHCVGLVNRLLSDDLDGDKHQRFILKISSGQTLLIAHNIDLSTKVLGLKVGDKVEFFGEYEWNEQGGVIHWTHKDPNQKHIDGWLKHNGTKYE